MSEESFAEVETTPVSPFCKHMLVLLDAYRDLGVTFDGGEGVELRCRTCNLTVYDAEEKAFG